MLSFPYGTIVVGIIETPNSVALQDTEWHPQSSVLDFLRKGRIQGGEKESGNLPIHVYMNMYVCIYIYTYTYICT